MTNYTVKQLKDAMIELYPRKDDLSNKAYRIAYDLLESKIGEDAMFDFLDAYGI